MPLSVRNSVANTVVFAKNVGGDPVKVIWGPKGEPNDTQRVPNSLSEDIDFLNTLEQGTLEVLDGPPELVATLQFETEKAREMRAAADARSMNSLARRQERDMMQATCIGPGPSGRTTECGRTLLIAAKNLQTVPPLCEQHSHLSPQFFLSEEGSRGEGATHSRDGEIRREWRSVQMMPKATGL